MITLLLYCISEQIKNKVEADFQLLPYCVLFLIFYYCLLRLIGGLSELSALLRLSSIDLCISLLLFCNLNSSALLALDELLLLVFEPEPLFDECLFVEL